MHQPNVFTVLHISDFHFSRKAIREQEIIVKALVSDLEAICVGHRQPDLVIFTGDLVKASGTDDHFEAYDQILGRVAKAAKCSEERIFIVPGNHDASRDIITANEAPHHEWSSRCDDNEWLNETYADGKFDNIIDQKFSNFNDLSSLINSCNIKYSNVFAKIHYIEELNVEVLIINSAAFSTAGLPDFTKDLKKLSIPEYALIDIESHFKSNSFKIIACHHPIEWFSEVSSRLLKQFIQKNAHLHLFGHMHDPVSEGITSYLGNLYTNQSGAIFQGRNRYNGYALISVEPSHNYFETLIRSFTKDRSVFIEGIDVVPNGKVHSSKEAKQFWDEYGEPIDVQKFNAHLSGTCFRNRIADAERVSAGDKTIHDMFVAPPLKKIHIQHEKAEEEGAVRESRVEFKDLVYSDYSAIIVAPPEFGRTTLLKEIELIHLKDADTFSFSRLPVLIDFSDLKYSPDQALRLVKSNTSLDKDIDFNALVKAGRLCILVDDVDFSDAKRMSILRGLVKSNPKIRYIFSSVKQSGFLYGAAIDPEMPLAFDIIELCPFRRKDMRKLLTKWDGCKDVDGILDRVQHEIGEINLPFTAANGTILMVILEEQSGFQPINRSVLIEQFVDLTLKKSAVDQSRRETFDYHNKTTLIAYVAGWMARQDLYLVEKEQLRSVIKEHIDKIEVSVDITDLLEEFISNRLFVEKADGRLRFRYRAVLEYFIALHMRKDKEFKNWILDTSRFLRFTSEIQYYAGAVRDDVDLMSMMADRFDGLYKEIDIEFGGIDLHKISALKLPYTEGDASSIDIIASQLSEMPLDASSKDEELELDIPQDEENRQEVYRPLVENIGQKFLFSLLLLSGLVKNMEEIPGEVKRQHLERLWRGWGVFLFASLQIVPELVKRRKVRINGVLYEIDAPRSMSDSALARSISLALPTGISRLVFASLGSEKLEKQLVVSNVSADTVPLVSEFFRSGLIADLKLGPQTQNFKSSLSTLSSSAYLLESIIVKIAELRRYGRIDEAIFNSIKPELAESIASLRGATGKDLTEEKRKQIARLDRQGVVMKLKRLQESKDQD